MTSAAPREDAPAPRPARDAPVDKTLPVMGRWWDARRDLLATFRTLHDTHGDVVWSRVGGLRVLLAFGPDAASVVFRNADDAFSNRLGWRLFLDHVFPGALLGMDGDGHRQRRRIMRVASTTPSSGATSRRWSRAPRQHRCVAARRRRRGRPLPRLPRAEVAHARRGHLDLLGVEPDACDAIPRLYRHRRGDRRGASLAHNTYGRGARARTARAPLPRAPRRQTRGSWRRPPEPHRPRRVRGERASRTRRSSTTSSSS